MGWNQLPGGLHELNALKDSYIELTSAYRSFYSLQGANSEMARLPFVAGTLPANEYRSAAVALRTVAPRRMEQRKAVVAVAPGEGTVQEERDENDTAAREGAAEIRLRELDPKLLGLLIGARAAAKANNPDRTRHVTVSLRELFTHVLHRLAPDEHVSAWTRDPKHFHNGRPTRRTRLLFICRDLDSDPFATFVEKDVDAALKFLTVFQVGTHGVGVEYSAIQLAALIARMEGLLHFLVSVALEEP